MGDLQPGQLLTPTLRLVRAFGRGGMGSVWLADHLALKTQVVVKFMATELALSGDAVARFAREASAAAQVKSPHVVQMLDHGVSSEGLPYIVMELLEGRELSKYIEEHGRLTLRDTSTILSQMGKALRRAHERHIVHRDIKPDNIFLCDVGGNDLFVKLLDFGIAKSTEAHSLAGESGTRTGAMIGTPYYMSPEQLVGAKDIDFRTDLWSLAVVAYQALTGTLPFTAETIAGLAIAIHNGPTPAPSRINTTLPPAIDAWFAQACARDPKARFPSAVAMSEAFDVAAGIQLSQSKTPSSPELITPVAVPAPSASAKSMPLSTQSGFGATLQPADVIKRSTSRTPFIVLGAVGTVVALGVIVAFAFSSKPTPAPASHSPSTPAAESVLPPAVTAPASATAIVDPPPSKEPAVHGSAPLPPSVAKTKSAPTPSVAPRPTPSAIPSARTAPGKTPTPSSKDFDHQ